MCRGDLHWVDQDDDYDDNNDNNDDDSDGHGDNDGHDDHDGYPAQGSHCQAQSQGDRCLEAVEAPGAHHEDVLNYHYDH